jgi:glycosyltransferase involved in cell wall biosynthesis
VKPLIVSQSDSVGGAARAALRLQRALVAQGIDSRMRVASRTLGDWRIEGPKDAFGKASSLWRPRAARLLVGLQRSSNPMPHSLQIWPSRYAREYESDIATVVNLHWVAGEMMSIADIGRINKPVVWTLHDSWAFCGAEHHPDSIDDRRYVDGYGPQTRRPGHQGLDLDAWCWRRKQRAWRRPFLLVSPSRWLADCARRSALMGDWPVRVIPNTLPLDIYRPWPRALARKAFGLPPVAPIVLFGAVGGAAAKGWDLLESALTRLAGVMPDAVGVIAGQAEPRDPPRLGMPLRFMGNLADDVSMALLYSAADIVVLPSRIENLPQMGTEAQACGVPVAAFDCAGLPDVVELGVTGHLAKPYDAADLAQGMERLLSVDDAARAAMSSRARERAVRLWSAPTVVAAYRSVFEEAVSMQGARA